jgi:metal-responsive CopG/Arc/MetJ family transcriptional regulator
MNQEKKTFETAITVKVNEDFIQELDKFATKMKLTRSQLVRNLLTSGLQDLKVMKSTGLLTMALKGYDVFDLIRQSLQDKKYRIEDEQLIIDL